jgi:hypothetical protein
MAHDSRNPRELSPAEVAAEVAAILTAAEHDARATIEAARRLPWLPANGASPAPTVRAENTPPAGERFGDDGERGNGDDDRVRSSLVELMRAVQALARRVEAIETALDGGLAAHTTGAERTPPPPFPAWERAKSPQREVVRGGLQAERVQAVDLALRGFSRAEIAAELRASMSEIDVEALLDDVLERV